MTKVPFLVAMLLVTGCDPGVHVGWDKDISGTVDAGCVERALRSVSPEVERGTYVSQGERGFPRGTEVTYFLYPDPVTHNFYTLDLAFLPSGNTRYVHQWGKIGTEIPAEEQAKVVPLLVRANNAVAAQCGLSVAASQPQVAQGA